MCSNFFWGGNLEQKQFAFCLRMYGIQFNPESFLGENDSKSSYNSDSDMSTSI